MRTTGRKKKYLNACLRKELIRPIWSTVRSLVRLVMFPNYFKVLTETVGCLLTRSGPCMKPERKSADISNSVELDTAARLTNNNNSSRKLKNTWLILVRSTPHTLIVRFNYIHQFRCVYWLNWGDRGSAPCSDMSPLQQWAPPPDWIWACSIGLQFMRYAYTSCAL